MLPAGVPFRKPTKTSILVGICICIQRKVDAMNTEQDAIAHTHHEVWQGRLVQGSFSDMQHSAGNINAGNGSDTWRFHEQSMPQHS